jgi:AcrR family transcriptional regulator
MKLSAKRSYRQTARAAAAKATGDRIADIFTAALRDRWFDEITLDQVARQAGVTVQTIIRRFGGKDGLLETARQRLGAEIKRHREVPVGDAGQAIDAIIDDYEAAGDLIVRLLAQEDRYAPLRAVTDIGRGEHRAWTGEIFAQWLDRLAPDERRAAHDALIVATDLYVWKLIRRDMKRSKAELRAVMARLAAAALHVSERNFLNRSRAEPSHAEY